MSTKYVESEARMMLLVLIEGIAEVKRLSNAAKCRNDVGWSDVLRERIKNGRRRNTERAQTEVCLCPGDSEKVSILRAESAKWQVSSDWWIKIQASRRWTSDFE